MNDDQQQTLKVLFVPSGPQRIASARIRAFQYLAPLRQLGIHCTIYPAMSEGVARLRVASPKMSRLSKLGYYVLVLADHTLRLIPILWLAWRADAVYLQRTTFPGPVVALLRWLNPHLVFDFDDAIHLRDPGDRETGIVAALKERMKSRAVPSILRASRCAIVEHDVLASYARLHCVRVETIPGPVDTDVFAPRADRPSSDSLVIGWIGTPLTSSYLPIVSDVLRRLAKRHQIELHLIGGGPISIEGVTVQVFGWSEAEESARLRQFDIGIMPMPDNAWTRGKLGLKMLLYMSIGIPAVVSHTPVNAQVIDEGVNGFIARTDQEWESALERLILDRSLRERIGSAGRRTVEERYSLHRAAPRLAHILEEIAGRPTANCG